MTSISPSISASAFPAWITRLRRIRVIPAFDRNEAALRSATTLPGRLLIAALYGAALAYFHFPLPWVYAGLILVASILPAQRLTLWVPVGGMALLLLSSAPFTDPIVGKYGQDLRALDPELLVASADPARLSPDLLHQAAALAIAFAILGGIHALVRRRRLGPILGFWAAFATGAALLAAGSAGAISPGLELASFLIVGFLAKFVVPFGYMLGEVHENPGFFAQLAVFAPPWSRASSAYPIIQGGRGEYGRRLENSARELAESQLKGLKLLLWSMLMAALLFRIPPHASYAAFNASGASLAERWLFASMILIQQILRFAVGFGTMVATARAFGFRLRRLVNRPYAATDMNDLYRRLQPHYIGALIHFIFYPVWNLFYWIRRTGWPSARVRAARLLLTCMVAVGGGGFLLHGLSLFTVFYRLGFSGGLRFHLASAPYFLGLGLATGISSVRAASRRAPGSVVGRVSASVIVLFGYFVLCLLGDRAGIEPLSDRVRFFLSLFAVSI